MRHLVTALRWASGLAALLLLVANLRLYSPGSAAYGPDELGEDVVPQLHFIGQALRRGAGERMQEVFPEGYFFVHVLYGLSRIEAGLRSPSESAVHREAVEEAGWALERIDSGAGRAPFNRDLDPPHGVFYVGWSNWLRGGLLLLQPEQGRPASQIDRFQDECMALAQAFERSPTPFLPAYPGQAWPVDSVVAVATLRLHDILFPERFRSTIQRWLQAAQDRLDPLTGLLPHRVESLTGDLLQGARGSSQSLITRFLIEVDPVWGRTQYALFRRQFVEPFLGAPGVREYPARVDGPGDIDSGPLVAGFSPSATVVMIGAAQVQGDRELADALIDASEAAGLPIRLLGSKRYWFGLLPIGDAFLVWAKTSRPWVANWSVADLPQVVEGGWRLPAHGVSLISVAGVWLSWRINRKRAGQRQRRAGRC
jgi:hypothetical protein